MKQLESFTIEQFRGLKDLKLEGLGRINLLVGLNNCGKTTVLESLSCFSRPLDGIHWYFVGTRRRASIMPGSRVEVLKWLFPQAKDSSPLRLFESGSVGLAASGACPVVSCRGEMAEVVGISGAEHGEVEEGPEGAVETLEAEKSETAKLRGARLQLTARTKEGKTERSKVTVWEHRGLVRRETRREYDVPSAFISLHESRADSSLASRFSSFRKEGLYAEALEVLRILDPDVGEMLVLAGPRGFPSLYIEHRRTGLTPVAMCGDGMRRAVLIALTVPRVKGGVLLVDEIESALHVSALTKVFQLLATACRQFDVQLFATTHSLEALDAMLEVALPDKAIDLVSYRLESTPTKAEAVRLDEKTLASLRNELGQEVR
jgi:ABC-type Na+ transport system ATPase subunit NatA